MSLWKSCLTHQLVGVPVERRLLQHKPVLLPFHTQEAFALFLPVQPALVIWLTQLFHRDPSPAHVCTIACTQKTHKYTETSSSFFVRRERATPQLSADIALEEAKRYMVKNPKQAQCFPLRVKLGHYPVSNHTNSKNKMEESIQKWSPTSSLPVPVMNQPEITIGQKLNWSFSEYKTQKRRRRNREKTKWNQPSVA